MIMIINAKKNHNSNVAAGSTNCKIQLTRSQRGSSGRCVIVASPGSFLQQKYSGRKTELTEQMLFYRQKIDESTDCVMMIFFYFS